uniref:Hypothetical 11.2 kDa protein n=1 Tax=Bradyrhizobium sp. (strain WM9) TaxID=133505 RepID=Q9AQ32_BRASW|nr:hypothetical 11.2 kDa protein [Bradyrhizobium sp. WM9]
MPGGRRSRSISRPRGSAITAVMRARTAVRRVRSHSPGATAVSIASRLRPTNIGTFFPLVKLMRAELSGVNCHGSFRRNVPDGQDVSRAQSLCDLREFEHNR